jgi:hypothetical protein
MVVDMEGLLRWKRKSCGATLGKTMWCNFRGRHLAKVKCLFPNPPFFTFFRALAVVFFFFAYAQAVDLAWQYPTFGSCVFALSLAVCFREKRSGATFGWKT